MMHLEDCIHDGIYFAKSSDLARFGRWLGLDTGGSRYLLTELIVERRRELLLSDLRRAAA